MVLVPLRFFSLSIATTLIALGFSSAAQARQPQADTDTKTAAIASKQISLLFVTPTEDTLPETVVSSGVRGNLQFVPIVSDAPDNRVGGGSRGLLDFQTNDQDTAQETASGGSRGLLEFSHPDGDRPASSTSSGGSRGLLDFHEPDDSASLDTSAGGVRGLLDFDNPDETLPDDTASGGSSRGLLDFSQPDDNSSLATAAGGSRGNDSLPLTAVLPAHQIGRTIAARPNFYIYVPPTASTKAFFSVRTAGQVEHYQMSVDLEKTGGVMKITLPGDAPELVNGEDYQWFFALIEPDGILRPDNYGVHGWIKRVDTLTTVSHNIEPITLASEYAQAGIWYDTLDIIAANFEGSINPETSWQTEWHDLLEQVGLEAIAAEPLLR
ncbi:protein of unknown function DUF928 [[Leptolyngbya] sp. PCC 7376]|uniref:DUF928 domain-containing protein n=1 Tax=[Leptolyngbya] sp. PCC 7376 TaxID=111781 RepID=UPI00029EDB30|nr:DUF928 domain-containing protein [[Leptolyngbya] sp. PCC 7376]AFY40320.1 protein of unknown function DUF928 [[Leptolyngbya] sp. PCC 7376]